MTEGKSLEPITLEGRDVRLEPLSIRRLGAKEEGILRRHVITSAGRVRDTVFYSIIDDVWPAVRARLEEGFGMGPWYTD